VGGGGGGALIRQAGRTILKSLRRIDGCRVPSLFEQVFRGALSGQIRISLYNTIWIFVVSCVTYGCGASLLGGSARLPIVADTADQRIP